MSLRAIVTAGGDLPGDLRALHDLRTKALLPLGGRTLLAQGVMALSESGVVESVVVVGRPDVEPHTPANAGFVEAGNNVVENILRGFLDHGGDERAEYIVFSPDLPFVTAEAVAEFISAARGSCEIGVPLVSREDFLSHFPGAPNKFERLSGRDVTMGSAIYMTGRMLKTNIPLWRDFYNARRFPLRLAALLGWSVAFGFITRNLRLEALEDRLSRITGGRAKAVHTSDATIAYDIDKRENYDYAMGRIRKAAG